MKQKIGMVGVGLMGHGIARNLTKHGYPLAALEHAGNQPLDALIAAGVTTVKTAAALAAGSDIVILCVTGSPEVEAVLLGEHGVLQGLRAGSLVIDCSTALPASTERMAQAVMAAGGRYVDAPMTRTAKEAHEGRLNLLVGCDNALFDEIKPVLACFAENITLVGPTGAGHRMKLLHNSVSLGFVALLAEAAACAERAGIAADVFVDVLGKGGGGGMALERLKPYLLSRDSSGLQFAMANAQKDLAYYTQMAADSQSAHAIADAVHSTYALAARRLGPQAMVPELMALLSQRGSLP